MAFSDLIAVYLFLGGTAAGTFAVLSLIDLCTAFSYARTARFGRTAAGYYGRRSRNATHRRVAALAYSVSLIMIVAGMLCLLADLGRPEAFYYIFLYPTSSFVSIGAFAIALMTLALGVAVAESVLVLGPGWEKAALVAKAAGVVLSIVVMVYTGMLLETVLAVKLWRSLWLPVLFLFSALSCGCAVVILCMRACEGFAGVRAWMRSLAVADLAFVVLEVIAAVAYLISVGTSASFALDELLFGPLAWLFWLGFAGCGLAAPLVLEVDALFFRRGDGAAKATVAAALVLAGGLCLRFSLVLSGIHIAL